MDQVKLRAIAARCRELGLVAVRDDIREQLRQWAEEFDAEAEAMKPASSYQARQRLPR